MTPGGRWAGEARLAARRAPTAASGALAGGMRIHPAKRTTPGWPQRQASCRFGTIRIMSGHRSRRAGRLPPGRSLSQSSGFVSASPFRDASQRINSQGGEKLRGCERCSARANPSSERIAGSAGFHTLTTERQNLSGGAIGLPHPRAGRNRRRAAPSLGCTPAAWRGTANTRQVMQTRCLCGLTSPDFLTLPRAVTYHGDRFTCSGGARVHPLP